MDIQAFGHFLRESREKREISLEEAVKTLKIQKRILESFEEGDFSQGGSPVQVRGMLRNYARFLRLEEDVVLHHYEAALIPPKTNRWLKRVTDESQAVKPATQPRRDTLAISLSGGARRSNGPRFAWVGRLLTTLVGVGLIGLIGFFVWQILERTPLPEGSGQPTLAAQISTIDPTLATATNTATATMRPELPTQKPTLIFLNGAEGTIVDLNFVQSSWARVISDGTEEFTGIARPGDAQTYNVKDGIEITLANAAGVELSIGGQLQPSLGKRGEQVLVLLNATGFQVIQPGATPTIDENRVISPETFTITETADPALLSAPVVETSISEVSTTEPTLIETDIPATATEMPTVASITPDSSFMGTTYPTLTPFSFMPNAAATEPTSTAVQITPAATLTPSISTPTVAAQTNQGADVPTLTPFNFMPQATQESQTTQSSADAQAPSPTQGQVAQATSQLPSPSAIPTMTLTATATPTDDIRPTAIVPLRITQAGLPTKKAP